MEITIKTVSKKISGKCCDIMFFFAFLFSLSILTLIHYFLANSGPEFSPIIDIQVHQVALAVEWIFAIVWTSIFFIYYSLRGGQLLQAGV